MSSQVRISHPEELPIERWEAPGETKRVGNQVAGWSGNFSDRPQLVSCIAGFDGIRAFNAITVGIDKDHPELFPETFRFEISNDGKVWEPVLRESGFRPHSRDKVSWTFSLITARYVKFIFLASHAGNNGSYQAAFGSFSVNISGAVGIESSSELDRLWVKENLFDTRSDYGWSSSLRGKREEESIFIDLGSINRVGEIRLLSKDDPECFFPEVFRFSYSEDNISWHHLLEENGFLAEPGTWYRWRFIPQNFRYIKIIIDEGARTREGRYISQIIEMELFAHADSLEESGSASSGPLHVPYASVLRSGIVRFAMDGESSEGVALQASDRRLRSSTTENPGIVELAGDGEDISGVVVQGNDRRLKYATEDLPGIVRLARDSEERANHVVQSNDTRLKLASESFAGIVELAEDGEVRSGVVVQGSDSRLKHATTARAGILKISSDGGSNPNEAVQGSDSRLKEATTESYGIVKFAIAGDASPLLAVQGNDPRLRNATTEYSGIVELARDGEAGAGVVVQGNDSRIKPASEDRPGIVSLNPPGSSMAGKAVQGNDPRLSDARPPVEHKHNYAPLLHEHSSHNGTLKIESEMGKGLGAISVVPVGHAPVSGVNTGEGSGISGKGRLDGVMGSGGRTGVVGMSTENGSGVLGASRSGPGGRFISEKGYSLVVGGKDPDRDIRSSALGLLVNGKASFLDPIYLPEREDGSAALACYFPVDSKDVAVTGDVLVASSEPGKLARSSDAFLTSVIGVVVENAGMILNSPAVENYEQEGYTGPMLPRGQQLVAISGVVRIRAKVEGDRVIEPGSLLVTSFEMGVSTLAPENVPVGAVFARSLDVLREGEGMIRAVLTL